MEKTNLWPRPLDEKNLTTDWIEEMFDCGGWMPTPYCKNGNNQYLTYIGETLVKVSWEFGKNQLAFIVIPDIEGCESYLKEKLQVDAHGNSPDGQFTLITVACMGACSIAPVIKIDGEFYGHLNTEKLETLLAKFREVKA